MICRESSFKPSQSRPEGGWKDHNTILKCYACRGAPDDAADQNIESPVREANMVSASLPSSEL